MSEELNRREIFKFTAGTLIAASVAIAQEHKFFTPAEFSMTEELTDILIPTDEKSPGARAAKAAEYIDGSLAEAFDDEERQEWRKGLAAVDALSQKINHAGFLKGTLEQRQAVMLEIARNEKNPKAPEELFFRTLKAATVHAYYSSKIGIHTDLDYKGNVYQGGEYAGVLPVGPALGSHTGTK
jgi:hypothetical protein